jgi:hypothetical protein
MSEDPRDKKRLDAFLRSQAESRIAAMSEMLTHDRIIAQTRFSWKALLKGSVSQIALAAAGA